MNKARGNIRARKSFFFLPPPIFRGPGFKRGAKPATMDGGDGKLVALMQRRAVLKRQLRDWTKTIKAGSGREPSQAECESNKPMLQEYKQVKDQIESIISSEGNEESAPGAAEEPASGPSSPASTALVNATATSSWFAAPTIGDLAGNLTGMVTGGLFSPDAATPASSDQADVGSSWLPSAVATFDLASFWEGVPNLGFYEVETVKPTAVASSLDDDTAPAWMTKWKTQEEAKQTKKSAAKVHKPKRPPPLAPAAKGQSSAPSVQDAREGFQERAAARKEQMAAAASTETSGVPFLGLRAPSERPPPPAPPSAAEATAPEDAAVLVPVPAPAPAPSRPMTVPEKIADLVAKKKSGELSDVEFTASKKMILLAPSTSGVVHPPSPPPQTGGDPAAVEAAQEVTAETVGGVVEESEEEGDEDEEDGEKSKDEQIKLMLDRTIRQFNLSAKKGVKHMIDSGMIQGTPNEVADFLCNTKGLNKAQIGAPALAQPGVRFICFMA